MLNHNHHNHDNHNHSKTTLIRPNSCPHPATAAMNSVSYNSKPKEVRIDYTSVKRNDSRRDSRLSHVSHTSSILHGYGCECPPTLKKFIKYFWILILIIYIVIVPFLLSRLHTKLKESNGKLQKLEQMLNSHIQPKALTRTQKPTNGHGKSNGGKSKDGSDKSSQQASPPSQSLSKGSSSYTETSRSLKQLRRKVQEMNEKIRRYNQR